MGNLDIDDLDASECRDCCGSGKVDRWHAVTHQLGTDDMPFREDCPSCEGMGFVGRDAELRATFAKE